MIIKSLANTPLDIIIDCLLESFRGYFVQMPADLSYWERRFRAARVDMDCSFGMFDKGQLVGFIINGIDKINTKPTAFNTGTGVLPAYRGRGIVDSLYDHALPVLKQSGTTHCRLEVIVGNERAIKVYERIGFQITRRLHCFNGCLNCSGDNGLSVKSIDHPTVLCSNYADEKFYSWDHTREAILAAGSEYKSFKVFNGAGQEMGYFTINPSAAYLARLEKTKYGTWENLLLGVKEVSRDVKINNVDESRTNLRKAFTIWGLENVVDQYEMEMKLD